MPQTPILDMGCSAHSSSFPKLPFELLASLLDSADVGLGRPIDSVQLHIFL